MTGGSPAAYGLEDASTAGSFHRDGSSHPHASTSGVGETNDHLASIYHDADEQFGTVVPFIQDGLDSGERCLYVADDNTEEEVLTAFRAGGIDVDRAVESGGLAVHTKADTYLRTGEFDREAMIEFWEETLARTRHSGRFEGIRAAAEMTWALDSGTDLDYLVEYEAALNTVYPGEDYVVLCQYNRNRFPPDVIADVVRTHPLVVHDSAVRPNPSYQPPGECIDRDGSAVASTPGETRPDGSHTPQSRSGRTPDATEAPGSEQAVDAIRERMELALESRDSVLWEWYPDTDTAVSFPSEATLIDSDVESYDAFVEVIHPDDRRRVDEALTAAVESGEELSVECRVEPDRGLRWLEISGRVLRNEQGEATRIVGIARDVTERKVRERDLQRYETIVETTDDFVYTLDAEGHFTSLNEASRSLTGVAREDLLGEHVSTVFHDETVADVEERIVDLLREEGRSSLTEELPLSTVDGLQGWYEINIAPLLDEDGTFEGTAGVAREITDRKRHESRLAILNRLTRSWLDADTHQQVVDRVIDDAELLLDLPVALVAFYDDSTNALAPLAATQTAASDVAVRELLAAGSPAWRTFAEDEPRRLTGESDLLEGGAGPVGIWPLGRHGVFVASVDTGASLSDAFGATVASTMQSALDSAERLQRLEDHRCRLTDLTDQLDRVRRVNDVIRRVDRALVSASTRSAIEAAVCEELADFEPYRFVVMGEYDRVDDRIVAGERAGTGRGYLDAVDPGSGPPCEAAATGDSQVVQNLVSDPPLAFWREAALARGFGSCLALALTYNDSHYGVLTVFGDGSGFDGMEQAVLGELADNVARAINAVESKRALVSDRVVELEFRTHSEAVPFIELATETGGTFQFESVVPQADGRLRAFFTVRGATVDDVREFLGRVVAVEDHRLVAERDDGLLFSGLLTEKSVTHHLVDHGVVPRELTADPGTGRLVVELPLDSDVRGFVETLEARCPDVELVAKRTRDRSLGSLRSHQGIRGAIEESLTDRQAEVLRTAYNSGYFESPRESTGEAVADALDISQPTFATHLRTAHRTVLDLVYDGGNP